jgi:26S proteasome regulatory subunit N2
LPFTGVDTDSAVAGEAAGYAMGLVMLGSADPTCADEMLTYAKETHREKIIRGLAMGLAFIFYGRQEDADSTIVSLLAEKASGLPYSPTPLLKCPYRHAYRQFMELYFLGFSASSGFET